VSNQLAIEGTGILAGVLTAISMLPQVIKIAREKKVEDVSIIMLVTLICGISLWIAYGIMKKDLPIIFTNAFSLLVNIILIVLRIKFKK
jgi:MtN3 and saliva related transmembrane protein